jgi:hypothetical protein
MFTRQLGDRPKVRGQLTLRGRTGRVTGNGRGQVQWRVMVEVSSAVGAKQVHEVHAGGSATPGCSAATVGLSLAEANARRRPKAAVAAAGCPTPALGRRLALAISMNERMLIDVVHCKLAGPVSATFSRSAQLPCSPFTAESQTVGSGHGDPLPGQQTAAEIDATILSPPDTPKRAF